MPEVLRRAPVIAAVRDQARLQWALKTPVRVIFLLGGDMFSLPGLVSLAQAQGRLVFVHMDLMDGFSRDAAGVRLVAKTIRPTGILSTRGQLLKAAADEGLQTVLRIFMVDSSSMETGERMVRSYRPDLVEIMPGLLVRAIMQFRQRVDVPVIAGGMVDRESDVRRALEAGAYAVSTSAEALWQCDC